MTRGIFSLLTNYAVVLLEYNFPGLPEQKKYEVDAWSKKGKPCGNYGENAKKREMQKSAIMRENEDYHDRINPPPRRRLQAK